MSATQQDVLIKVKVGNHQTLRFPDYLNSAKVFGEISIYGNLFWFGTWKRKTSFFQICSSNFNVIVPINPYSALHYKLLGAFYVEGKEALLTQTWNSKKILKGYK